MFLPSRAANKNEFVELKARFIMCEQRQQQLDALRDGFKSVSHSSALQEGARTGRSENVLCKLHQVLPLDEIASFDVSELELVLCGVPALDIEDWRAHTNYTSGASRLYAS